MQPAPSPEGRGQKPQELRVWKKAPLAVTSQGRSIVLDLSYGNPYDGHDLDDVVTHIRVMTGKRPERCDLGRSWRAVRSEPGSCDGTHFEKRNMGGRRSG